MQKDFCDYCLKQIYSNTGTTSSYMLTVILQERSPKHEFSKYGEKMVCSECAQIFKRIFNFNRALLDKAVEGAVGTKQ